MRRLALAAIVLIGAAACSNEAVPRATPTVAPTHTPTSTSQATEVALEPTHTPLATPTPRATDAPTSTATSPPSATPSESATATNTATETFTPSATNTPNPSQTPTRTATITDTPSNTPTDTRTPTNTATATPNPSETPSLTPTQTATRTATATQTFTASPSPTNTLPPTVTPLPLPLPPTDTATPTATLTPFPSLTASATRSATPTNTPLVPTADATRIADALTATHESFLLTQTAQAPSPTPTPTHTLLPTTAPTLDATPVFITAAPRTPVSEDLGLITPLPPAESATPEERFEATPTPLVAPTVELIAPLPPTVSLNDLPISIAPLTNTNALAFALSTAGGLSQGAFGLLDNVNLFARNPVNAGQYVATNGAGVFYIVNNGVPSRPNTSPFSEFEPRTVEENQYFVEYIRWSPNGAWVGFIIDGERHPNPTAEDGVHIYNPQTGEIRQLLRDAPYNGHPGTQLGGARQWLFDTSSLQWAPGSDLILVRARIGDPGANTLGGLMVVDLGHDPSTDAPSLICDSGSWSADGSRIIVSGNCNGMASVIASTDRGLGDFQVIFDAAQNGYWVQDAVQRGNGQIVALGRQGDRNGPMRIIDSEGNFLTGDIGGGPPQRVEWSPDRGSVLVVAGGRYYIAQVNGFVSDITNSVGSVRAVNWVSGGLPEGTRPSVNGPTSQGSTAPPGEIPSGVIEGSIYSAGQQLQVVSETLNLRDNPGLNSTAIGSLNRGDYVVILAGPASIDGFFWWFVQTANRQTGWIAGEINGFSTLR